MPNVKLLKRTLAHIEAHPDEWTQEAWRCETGMCFAGWAAQLAGGHWYTDTNGQDGGLLLANSRDHPAEIRSARDLFEHVGVIHAEHRARRLLDLDNDQAGRLFSGDNSLDDIRDQVQRLVGETTT